MYCYKAAHMLTISIVLLAFRCVYWALRDLSSVQNAKALKAKKEEGNNAFKDRDYDAAYQLYTEALTIDPNNIKTNAKLYCNRATAGAKVRFYSLFKLFIFFLVEWL